MQARLRPLHSARVREHRACFVENIGIWHADNASRAGILEIDRGLTAAQAKNYLLVEICISQEPRPHVLELGAPFRAASSLE
jgi:hypothetical protein